MKFTDHTNRVVQDGNSSFLASTLDAVALALVQPADPLPLPPPKQFTSLEFLDLFTQQEQVAIATAAMSNVQAKLWYDRTLAAMFITLADPRTEAGLSALVGAGLLTEARKAEILAVMA